MYTTPIVPRGLSLEILIRNMSRSFYAEAMKKKYMYILLIEMADKFLWQLRKTKVLFSVV